MFRKNSSPSSTLISRTSAIERPLYLTSSVSRLYRLPLQTSQVTYTSGRKCISILIWPSPAQFSHRPPRVIDHAGVGRGVRPRRSSYRRLIDVDHLVDLLPADEALVLAGQHAGPIDLLVECPQQNVLDQGRLPRARYTGHAHEQAQRDLDRHVFQVVLAGALESKRAFPGDAADLGNRDRARPG